MKSSVYPKAIFADNGISGGSYTSGPPKLVIHTTETSGMPGYSNGATAPHVTYDPRSRIFIQHRTFKAAARSLRNEAGGVQTNRDTALQLEIICYSNKPLADAKSYRDWVGDLPKIPGAIEDITDFINWVCKDWGVQNIWPGKVAGSYGAANNPGFRMTNSEWDNYNGVCGHQHVPENDHWDPGAFPWNLVMVGDEMTPEQESALNWLVRIRTSTAEPAWGGTAWKEFLKIWSSGAHAERPVQFIQLAHTYYRLLIRIKKLEKTIGDIGSASGMAEEQIKEMIENTSLVPPAS